MTKHLELAENESLRMEFTCCRPEYESETIEIGWVDEDLKEFGSISILLAKWRKDYRLDIVQVCPNEEEIDLIIDGLRKAKRHMREVRK